MSGKSYCKCTPLSSDESVREPSDETGPLSRAFNICGICTYPKPSTNDGNVVEIVVHFASPRPVGASL